MVRRVTGLPICARSSSIVRHGASGATLCGSPAVQGSERAEVKRRPRPPARPTPGRMHALLLEHVTGQACSHIVAVGRLERTPGLKHTGKDNHAWLFKGETILPGVGPEPHGGDLTACARPAVDRHQLVGRAGALGERTVLHGFRLVRAAAPAGGELGWPGDRARRDAGRTGSTATASTRARPAIPRSISANSFRALQAGTRPHAPSASKSSTRLKAAR